MSASGTTSNSSLTPLRPQNAERFRCTGPDCEDTCCKSWNIFIDRDTYKKYRNASENPLRVLAGAGLKRVSGADPLRYASIKLNQEGFCPFFSPDRLCSIQKDYGEAWLSKTCAQYPRSRSIVGGVQEETLLLSCPEAARLVLLDPEFFAVSSAQGLTELPPGIAPPSLVLLAAMRNFSILLIRDRRYALWERLFLLSLLCKRLEALIVQKAAERIPQLLAETVQEVEGGSLQAVLQAVPLRTEIQVKVMLVLLDSLQARSRHNKRLAECVQDFAAGIGYGQSKMASDLTENYTQAFRQWYAPWVASHEHVLENYLINYVFAHLFPFVPRSEERMSPWREARLFCLQFGLVRGLLAGMAGHYCMEFSVECALKLIQSFSREVEHSASFLRRVDDLLIHYGLDGSDGVAALLRDPA